MGDNLTTLSDLILNNSDDVVLLANAVNSFNDSDFNNWKEQQTQEEQTKEQVLEKTEHTNTGSYHPNHSNGGGYHSNNHSDGTEQTGHFNAPSGAGHVNQDHINYTGSGHSQGSGSSHSDIGGGHTNMGHVNQPGSHANVPTYTHSNNGGHSNSVPHYNSGHNNNSHNNVGFDHENYVPSEPSFYQLEGSEPSRVHGTISIGLFSYDKNNDGHGTQDSLSKTVKYNLRIRKVENLDGTGSPSSWRDLLVNSPTEQYSLNTIDPLGTGNTDGKLTEGIYELEAWALNDPKTANGVTKTYESSHKTVLLKVQQNQEPTITVENATEFINFTFGNEGALNTDGNYVLYSSGLYSEATEDKQAGIFATVNMTDPDDMEQWQKAKIYLVSSDGVTKIPGTEVEVIWEENGSTVISSRGTAKKGYAFIAKDRFLSTDLSSAMLAVEVSDYADASCTEPALSKVVQKTISTVDPTDMHFNVDIVPPVTVTTSVQLVSTGSIIKLYINTEDNLTNLKEVKCTLHRGTDSDGSTKLPFEWAEKVWGIDEIGDSKGGTFATVEIPVNKELLAALAGEGIISAAITAADKVENATTTISVIKIGDINTSLE